MRRKPVHYYDECWQQSFWFMIGWDGKQAARTIDKLGFPNQQFTKQGRTVFFTDGSGPIIIWVVPRIGRVRTAAVLAHECVHAAGITLQRAGVVADWNNDEPLTYLVTILMRKALE